VTSGRPRAAAPEPPATTADVSRRRSVGALLLVTVLLTTTVVVGAIGLSFRWSSERATSDARRDARFQARLAADGVENSLRNASASLATGAATPAALTKLAATGPCSLTRTGLGPYPGAHLDLVRPDGTVTCSSMTEDELPPAATHGPAPWVGRALVRTDPTVSTVTNDALTGHPAVMIAAPVRMGTNPVGLLTAVIPVETVAESLARAYASPRRFTFTVVEPSTGIIRSASGAPRAAGRRIGTSGFAGATSGTWEAPDGAERLFESAAVPTLGWRVFAGLKTSAVTDAVREAAWRQLLLAAVALLSLAAIVLLVSRRIVRPLQSVTNAIVEARDAKAPAPVEVTGPREIAILATEFNTMIETRVEYEARLAERAVHDDLTELPNRVLLRDRIAQALHRRATHGGQVAVLFLDLDRFKLVNDTYGHPIGDSLLRLVATRLERVVREHDTLARFGGDEFVVVCEEVEGVPGAVAVANQLADALASPFSIGGKEIAVSARIGITLADGPGLDADELVREADIAMYHAKQSGRAWELWDDDLRARSAHRLELQQDLRTAIANRELRVEYQPIFDISEWRIVGAEALVRWEHPRLGRLAPARFIPLAEDSGQIAAIGEYVLEEACTFIAGLDREGLATTVSVNVAVAQLNDLLAPLVGQLLVDHGLAPSRLCLEITESALVEAFGAGADTLAHLRAMGLHIAVDDFGTGYSSLSYLQHFPFDSLKIDRSFIEPLGSDDGRSSALVRAIINMAEAFQLHVVAEGVETPAQLAELRRLGCPFVQGFLLAEPMPPDELRALIVRQRDQHHSAPDAVS
jgi:diguanylate cyclase (GGDEF)-like protein